MVKRSQQLQYSFQSIHPNLVVIHPSEDPHSDGWEDLHQTGSADVLLLDADRLLGVEPRNRLVRDLVPVHQILEGPVEATDVTVVLLHLLRAEMPYVDLNFSSMTSSHDFTHTHSIIFQFFSISHDFGSHLAFYKYNLTPKCFLRNTLKYSEIGRAHV